MFAHTVLAQCLKLPLAPQTDVPKPKPVFMVGGVVLAVLAK